MISPQEKFQTLLRELFQFDCADLDFGIYRIMNYKRGVIEKFITEDLPEAVSEELNQGILLDQAQIAGDLKETKEQIVENLGRNAPDGDGSLAEAFHGTPLGDKYRMLKAKAEYARDREGLESAIFNHLYAFFRRYCQDGDVISRRRYSKRQKYAIPYNGEEVYLHWANRDQYYVKTAGHFQDYTYRDLYGTTVHFQLKAADVEQNNVKGDKRFFVPSADAVRWDEKANTLVIPFEYRPLTEAEAAEYGTTNQQEKIIAHAVEVIPERVKKVNKAFVALTEERRKTSDDRPVNWLEHHLRRYTRRNGIRRLF